MDESLKLLKYRMFIPRDKLMQFCGGELVKKFPELSNLEVALKIEYDEEGLFVCLEPKSILSLGPQEQGKRRN